MTNLGEKLSDDELNELFKELKMEKDDTFNYEEFIRTILTRWLWSFAIEFTKKSYYFNYIQFKPFLVGKVHFEGESKVKMSG